MENINCPACKSEQIEKIEFCKNCKFPFKGTEKERAIHIGKFINKKGVIFDSSDSIERSQQILFGIAGINLFFIIFGYFTIGSTFLDIIINLIITAIIAFFGYKIKENPIRYTLIPLILLLSIYTFNFIFNPILFRTGIMAKLAIIGALCYSIYLIKSAEKFKTKFNVKE
ncbi:hypothetical protein [Tenacibaculum sp. nBUS_03]|uniref:hypothetical protein n=1 Tax=Tenacibaculum sp. nBUS_03 TaxID=3395320 RepID=UPI003EC10653